MQKLHPKAVWLFFWSYLMLWFYSLVGLVFVLGIIILEERGGGVPSMIWSVVGSSILVLAVLVAVLFVWAKLSYHFYRYELREDGFRKESGVIWKKYVTIPYERIQNVDIYRGILTRILGLSDLHVQTAGASATIGRHGLYGMSSEGRLPGISKEVAEQLRDELVRRARSSKSQGL